MKLSQVSFKTKSIHSLMALGNYFPRLWGKLSHRLFITPLMGRKKNTDPLFKQSKKFTLKYKNKDLVVYEWGTGDTTVLVVHGWQSQAQNMLNFVEPFLEVGYKVVMFDNLAHGSSDGYQATFSDSVGATKRVLDYIRPDFVVGHSYGASTVLVNMGGELNFRPRKIVTLSAILDAIEAIEKFMSFAKVPKAVKPYFYENVVRIWGKSAADFSCTKSLEHCTVSGLMFHDEYDQVANYSGGKEINKAWKNSKLITTSGLGHYRILKDKKVTNSILAFLENDEI